MFRHLVASGDVIKETENTFCMRDSAAVLTNAGPFMFKVKQFCGPFSICSLVTEVKDKVGIRQEGYQKQTSTHF